MKFQLYKQGPDNRSTYPECFGNGSSDGRLVAEADTLAGLLDAANGLGHSNWSVKAGKKYYRPEEFFASRSVRKVK